MRRTLLVALLLAVAAPLAAADTITLSTPRDRKVGVNPSEVVLGWLPLDRDETGTKYTVEMSTASDFSSLVPLEKAAVEYDKNKSASLSYMVSLPNQQKLADGTRYYWRVVRECAGCVPVRSEAREFTIARKFFGNAPIKISQTALGDNAAKPAKFKFIRTPDKNTGENENTYSADFAVQYTWEKKFREIGSSILTPTAYLESVLNSSTDADTAIRVAGGLEHVFPRLVNTYVIKLEGDQDLDKRNALAEATFAPSFGKYIGAGFPCAGGNRCTFQPTLITAYGRTLKRTSTTKTDDSVVRLGVDLALLVDLYPLSQRLNVPVTFSFTDTAYYLPDENEERKNLLKAAIDLEVASGVTVGVEYKHGAQAPEFKGTHSIGLTLGLKVP